MINIDDNYERKKKCVSNTKKKNAKNAWEKMIEDVVSNSRRQMFVFLQTIIN